MKTSSALCRSFVLVGLIYGGLAEAQTGSPSITANPGLAGSGVSVGISKRDGITVSGGEAFVTRNGVTEKMMKELKLPSGVIARPDGTILLEDNTTANLRGTQVLTFEGQIMDIPFDPNVNAGDRNAPGASATGGAGAASPAPGGAAPVVGSSRSTPSQRPNGAGNVYLGSDGVPFMGTQNADGTILRSDGTVTPLDGTIRVVTFGADGTPSLGAVNANGTPASGNSQQPNSSSQNQLGTGANGNSNPGVPQNAGTTQTNSGVTSGVPASSSSNGNGTVNQGNANGAPASGGSDAGTGNSGSSNSGTSGGTGTGSTRGTNGASGGAASGGGASGAGGAPGGAAGGASR